MINSGNEQTFNDSNNFCVSFQLHDKGSTKTHTEFFMVWKGPRLPEPGEYVFIDDEFHLIVGDEKPMWRGNDLAMLPAVAPDADSASEFMNLLRDLLHDNRYFRRNYYARKV